MGNVNTRNNIRNRAQHLGDVISSSCNPMMSKCCGRGDAATDEVVNNYQYDSDASKKSIKKQLMSSMNEDPMGTLSTRKQSKDEQQADFEPLIEKRGKGALNDEAAGQPIEEIKEQQVKEEKVSIVAEKTDQIDTSTAKVEEKKENTDVKVPEKIVDNMEDFYYDYCDDPDAIIDVFQEQRLDFEVKENINFSMNGIKETIETILAREHPDVDPKWEQKLKTPTIIYYLKKGGSHLNKSQPFIRSECIFPKAYKMDKLMKAIMAPEQIKWDKNVLETEIIGLENEDGKVCKSAVYTYMANKKSWGINSRDFYEKAVIFSQDGCLYKYSSSCKDDLELRPKPYKDTVRGTSLITAQKFWRDPTTQKIHFVMVCQCDFKLEVPQWILAQILPGAAKAWVADAMKHYTKNHKKL